MNVEYMTCLLATAVLSAAWLALRLKKQGMNPISGVVGMVFAIGLGAVMAKLFYVTLLIERVWPRFGWEAFIRVRASEFSFLGGGVGVVVGMLLAAKATRQDWKRYLDAFAPCGALMAAGARFAERWQGMLGVGSLIKNDSLCFFPFGVSNQWGEWFFAVFMLETLAALLIALIFALRKPEVRIPGLHVQRVAFYLCLTQVLCESLRAQGMRWGFVRVEQVLSGVALIAFLLNHCLRVRERNAWKRFWPIVGAALCIASLVGVEFALDKTDMSPFLWYGVMIGVLTLLGAMEGFCVRRRRKQATVKLKVYKNPSLAA